MAIAQLGQLVTMLRQESGASSSPNAGIQMRDTLVYLLNRTQEQLALDWDLASMVVDRDIPVVIGTRYYQYASDLPFEAVNRVTLIQETLFDDLCYGIGPNEYALFNSNTGVTEWPILRWMHNADRNLFEVWPVPSEAPPATGISEAALIRMRGIKAIPMMVADSDMCVLPATVIVLFAAAELMARKGDPSAGDKLSKANAYLRRLRVRSNTHKQRPFVIGGGGTGRGRDLRVGLDYIPEGYGKGPGT